MHGIVVQTDCGNRAGYDDHQSLRCTRHGCRHPFPKPCDEHLCMYLMWWCRYNICVVADVFVYRRAALGHILLHYSLHLCLGMGCGNRAGNAISLGDEAEQRRHGCRHLSQYFAHAKCSMPCCDAHYCAASRVCHF